MARREYTKLEFQAVTEKERERLRKLRRAQTDLWWLATEIMGFDLLTTDFHKPMMDELDDRRSATQGRQVPQVRA